MKYLKKIFPSYIPEILMILIAALCVYFLIFDALHSGCFSLSFVSKTKIIAYTVFILLTVRILYRTTKNTKSVPKKYIISILTLLLLTAAVFVFNSFLQYLDWESSFGSELHVPFTTVLCDNLLWRTEETLRIYLLYFVCGLAVYVLFERKVFDLPAIKNLIFEPEPEEEYVKIVGPEGRKKLMELLEDVDHIDVFEQHEGKDISFFFMDKDSDPPAGAE